MKSVVRVISIAVGLLFIVSGFVKVVDPLGFSYKLDEYFEVFAADTNSVPLIAHFFEWLKNLSLFLSMFFCVLEMALGVAWVFGIWMNLTSWLMLLMIVFFTWLTGYSALTGKVTDCGCFGDALKLTPWQTFSKDIVLLVLIIIVFAFRNSILPLFKKKVIGYAIIILSVLGFSYLTIYCYRHLPIIDFRAYKVGNDIREQMTLPPGKTPTQYQTILTYNNRETGDVGDYAMISKEESESPWFKERNIRMLPWQDSLWLATNDFVKSDNIVKVKGDKPKITDFRVWDNDNVDLTSTVLDEPNYHFWVVAYDMECTNRFSFNKINELAAACEKNNYPFVALTATSYSLLDPIRHELGAAFPFYYADGTVLKTVIRSNPGLILLKGSKVLAMWHYNDIPSFETVRSEYMK